ncbi:MAG: hypothetical protein NTZ42_04680 [Candidatus Gribaldobacteria bacterium]|nr:hypothetical protein [Candidatus Gribaldobacteria bacterium]
MVTKETILKQLNYTSNDIVKKFDVIYSQELMEIVEEMAISYQILHDIINREDQSKVSDADFQSALLFWTALNTYLAAIELFRRGYGKEPQMLIRNTLETFSAAYDIHIYPHKLNILQQRPKDFDSKQSIKIAKKIHPIIGQMWGKLSAEYSHVGVLHTLPHKTAPLCVGGLFDSEDQNAVICGMLPPLNLALDILSSVLELTFITEIQNPRFWKQISSDTYQYSIPKINIERGERLMVKMEDVLKQL